MKVCFASLAALAVLASLTGCAMCRNPFDYCGPVQSSQGCPNCDFGARRGSIFAPMDGSPATTSLEPTPAQQTPSEAEPSHDSQDETPPGRTAKKDAGDTFER